MSASRFALAAVFPFVAADPTAAVAVMAAAGASDVLDGWLARLRHETTAMGAVVDAVADKVFVASVVVTLAAHGRIAGLDVALLFARELVEGPTLAWGLFRPRPFARERRANALGKATTVLQFATLVAVALGVDHHAPLYAAAAFGLGAGLTYARDELVTRRRPRDGAPLAVESPHA